MFYNITAPWQVRYKELRTTQARCDKHLLRTYCFSFYIATTRTKRRVKKQKEIKKKAVRNRAKKERKTSRTDRSFPKRRTDVS